MRPTIRPKNPKFSSGPTRKHPKWLLNNLELQSLGRSHRSSYGVERIRHLTTLVRDVLEIPPSYHIGIIPGSCTGAMEAALWSLLGPLPIDIIAFDIFGHLWSHDVIRELKLSEHHVYEAEAGYLPDLSKIHFKHDTVVTWNGTTTGVCIPNGQWIDPDRQGLVICDATSALFAVDFPWTKTDAVAFSWQKVLGGEGAHGMLVLSPRTIERLNTYIPPWPIPRLFRLAQNGKFSAELFNGMTLNTPSMLCIEDAIDSLLWCLKEGGLKSLINQTRANFNIVNNWVAETPWIDFLAHDPKTRSTTSICLYFPESRESWDLPKEIAKLLEREGVALDILGHTRSVPNLRIWGGPTVESSDIEALLPWITWAYKKVT